MGLRTAEVVIDARVAYFDIKPNENRVLKNESSRRRVPIHRRLLKLGLAQRGLARARRTNEPAR